MIWEMWLGKKIYSFVAWQIDGIKYCSLIKGIQNQHADLESNEFLFEWHTYPFLWPVMHQRLNASSKTYYLVKTSQQSHELESLSPFYSCVNQGFEQFNGLRSVVKLLGTVIKFKPWSVSHWVKDLWTIQMDKSKRVLL